MKKHCTQLIPYGIETAELPSASEWQLARQYLINTHSLKPETSILFFNGTLNYGPNLDALNHILHDILPRLAQSGLEYDFFVCGKNLPVEMDELKAFKHKQVHYVGFVPDIDIYFKACDVFLNPLIDGGGIKTKLVEALGFGKAAVSTQNGAIGVDVACTGGRLQVVPDNDWEAFAQAVLKAAITQENPDDNIQFYNTFYWGHIAEQAKQYCVE
jgi:glycosyltransferase involved in cell wall biosynthesis